MVGYQVERGATTTVSSVEATAMKPCEKGLDLFTPRQIEVIQWSARGLRAKEIADKLGVKRFTVQAYVRDIYKMGGVHSMAHAVATLYGID